MEDPVRTPQHRQLELEDPSEPDSSLFPTQSRPVWWMLAAAAVVIGLCVSVYFSYQGAFAKPTWNTTSWKVLSPAEVEVGYRLTVPRDEVVTCRLEALDFQHRLVGSSTVTFEAGERRTEDATSVVKTVAPAVTGRVRSCRLVSSVGSE